MTTKLFDRIFLSLAFLSVLSTAGCNKNTSEEVDPEDTYYSTGKAYLDEVFNTYYWWYDQVPESVVWNRDFYEYFDGCLVPQDRWSWMETGKEWRDSQSGTISGSFGASFAQPVDYGDYNIYVRYVYLNSPMYNAGVRRGWRLDGIGEYEVRELLRTEEGINTLYEEMYKSSNEYVFTSPDSTSHTLNLTASRISTHTYFDYRVFTSEDYQGLTGSVGYFNYWTFVTSMTDEVKTVFSKFKSAGVEDVILDLRYNSGGDIDALNALVSLIVPKSLDGEVFSVRTHNDLLSEWDDVDNYSVSDATLSLKRLFVITGGGTASASEVLISGLRDGLGKANLITVGDTTYGKPNGMYVFAYPEGTEDDYYSNADYVFMPICFYTCNRAGEQIPDVGFVPMHYVADDVYHDWGAEERLIASCLSYMVTGSFGDTKSSDCGHCKSRQTEGYRMSVEEDAPGYGRLIALPEPVR